MFNRMREEIRAARETDPAAPSAFIVWLCYDGLHAIWGHRLHHFLWEHGLRGLARAGSQLNRFFTGVEIHPGATIGRGCFIDHGMGVVIGETTIMGDHCELYQGVTLGGTGNETGKRHPTLCNNVVVGVGASVLGNITIGDNVRIGGGAVVVNDVPPNCTVVGIPGRIVKQDGKRVAAADESRKKRHEDLPDPSAEIILDLQNRIERLEKELAVAKGVADNREVAPQMANEAAPEENKLSGEASADDMTDKEN